MGEVIDFQSGKGKGKNPEGPGSGSVPEVDVGKLVAEPEPICKQGPADPDLMGIKEGRQALANKLLAYLGGPMSDPLLVRTTPGAGKTEAAVSAAIGAVKKGLVIFYAVTTRNMALQLHQRIKGGVFGAFVNVVNLEGRHDGYTGTIENFKTGLPDEIDVEPNCENYDRVQKATARGYAPGVAVCPSCSRYPHHKNSDGQKNKFHDICPYYQTMYRAAGFVGGKKKQDEEESHHAPWGRIIIMAHQKLATLVANGTEDAMIKPDLIIVDEDWSTALREQVAWSEKELQRKVKCAVALMNFRKLLSVALKIANKYKHQAEYPCGPDADKDKAPNAKALRQAMKESMVFGSYAVWGRRLMMFLREAASLLKVDLATVLVEASLADTGVSKGEYMSMSEERDATVPHSQEPELAYELKNVLDLDLQGKETCYRASLRFDKEKGWEYYWDNVRRMGYGGPAIFLDAYGDPEIVKRLCNDREPQVVTIKVRSRPNVEIHQHMCSTSRSVLDDKYDEVFDTYADPYLRRFTNQKVLFYGLKRYDSHLKKRVKEGRYGLKRGSSKWFWQDRGDDSYKDFDGQIILGTPFSNVVAERHFANAIFYGEEPLDWSVDKKKGMEPVDPRVLKHLQARQQKELQQACFRLRPASEAKDQKQTIVIISRMGIGLEANFAGARVFRHYGPPKLKPQDTSEAFLSMVKFFGGWTPIFCAFVGIEQRVFSWFEAGGVKSGMEFPITYEQMIDRYHQWGKSKAYKGFLGSLPYLARGGFKEVLYPGSGQRIRVAGDVERVFEALDAIKQATREPGVDDEPVATDSKIDPAEVLYDPMEDMDALAIQAIDEALGQVDDANDFAAVAQKANEIHGQLDQAAKKSQDEPATDNVIPLKQPRAVSAIKPRSAMTENELYVVAQSKVIDEFVGSGRSASIGTILFHMAVEVLFEEMQHEMDFKAVFGDRKDPSIGEEAPPPEEEDDDDPPD